jgi:hypothetical protein
LIGEVWICVLVFCETAAVIDVIVLAGMTEVVVGSTDVGVPVFVESVELGPVKGRALFSGTWPTDFAVVVEFLYAVERTLTEGGACVTNGAVSETDAVVLRLVKVGVVDVVEMIVVVVETVDGDEVVVTLASVPSVMGTIEFGLKKLVSLARLWFSQRWYTSELEYHTVCAPHLSGADLPRSRLRRKDQQKSDETLAYRQLCSMVSKQQRRDP